MMDKITFAVASRKQASDFKGSAAELTSEENKEAQIQ